MKEGLGGGPTTNRFAFDGVTDSGARHSELNCSFIAAYCDRKRFDPVGLAQCLRIALARVIALRSRRIVAAWASRLEGGASARSQAIEDELMLAGHGLEPENPSAGVRHALDDELPR